MVNWLKYVIAFASAILLMLLFRTLAFSIHDVMGNGLSPLYQDGDRLLVNRCSYGLRIPGNGLLPYSRLMRQPVKRGDIVAFTIPDNSLSDGKNGQTQRVAGIYIARCSAVPGDTIRTADGTLTVPGLVNCAKGDFYWLESVNPANRADSRYLGFIPESSIVGRVVTVVYNRKNFRLQ